jgi:hypothetical protein
MTGIFSNPIAIHKLPNIDTAKYYHFLLHNNTALMLKIEGSTANGSNIGVNTDKHSNNQRWKIIAIGQNYFKCISADNPIFVVDCSSNPSNGCNLQSLEYLDNDRQQWMIEDAGSGYFHMKVKNNSNFYLDMSGSNVQLWENANNDRQEWEFQALPINIQPTITISYQTNSTFIAPATLNIITATKDIDGSIAKVEFYNGSTKIGESTTSPYSFSWSNMVAGSYTITAKATDNDGAVTTSQSFVIRVNPQQTILLVKGWILIYTNIHPTDSCIVALFSGLDVQEIKTADAFWRKGQNRVFNSLKNITAGK